MQIQIGHSVNTPQIVEQNDDFGKISYKSPNQWFKFKQTFMGRTVGVLLLSWNHLPHLATKMATVTLMSVPLVEQELLNLLEHLNSSPVFQWGSCYSIFSFICMFCRFVLVLFLLAIVLSVLLRYTDSDYPFVIFKLFLLQIWEKRTNGGGVKLVFVPSW